MKFENIKADKIPFSQWSKYTIRQLSCGVYLE